jgi:hypothetical protein
MIRVLAVLPALAAAPAVALTPEELWGAWQGGMTAFGVTLGGEAVPGGDGSLALRNVTVEAGSGPEPLFPPGSPVQEVVLRPEGEAVVIDLGLGASTTFGDEAGGVLVAQEGLRITARDGAGGIDYDVVAASLGVAEVGSDTGGGTFAMEVTGLEAGGGGGLGPGGAVSLDLAADGYAYVSSASQADVEAGFGSSTAGRSTGPMTFAATLTMPAAMGLLDVTSPADFVRALEDGLALRAEFASEALVTEAWAEGFPFSYQSEGRSEPGTYTMSMDRAAAALVAEYGAGAVTVTAPDLPFGLVDLAYDRLAAEIRVPLTQAPGDLRYMMAVEGLVANEEAWAFLDPEGALPRDPARAVVDVGGRMGLDVAGLVASAETGGTPPVPTIESVEIRAFDVAGAGLAATGTGAFTFAGLNEMGVPIPVGQASLRLEGLDRLLDALVTLGAIQPEEATGVRVGAGAFFRAAGPDVRETTLDARADGSVVINGVKVQ